jgi:hypothetical protein
MIRLGGLVSQKAFGKFEMGKVISNPFANAFVNEAEGEDHEVSMGQNQLDTIIKMATELKSKMGENEKEIPAWIQDHISKAESYISQASSNYHEYGTNEGIVTEASDMDLVKNMEKTIKDLMARLNLTKDSKQREAIKKGIVVNMGILNFWKGRMVGDKIREVNEASPCWKGYKQVGMKNKGGRQVPNCVPNESIVKEGRSVKSIQTDYLKTIDTIQKELVLYKKHKDTPQAKKHVENLKKLNVVKNKLQNELDDSLYDDPFASKAKTQANRDIGGNYGPYNYDFD